MKERESVFRITNHLQAVLGYLQLGQSETDEQGAQADYDKALASLHETIREVKTLAIHLSDLAKVQLVGLDAIDGIRVEAKTIDIRAAVVNVHSAVEELPMIRSPEIRARSA
jgi:hypothetical protein